MSFLIQTVAGDLDWITRSGEPGSAIGFPIARVLLVAAVAAGAALIVVVAIHLDRARNGPRFRALARRLDLHREQQRLLGLLARAGGVRSPGSLLLSRGCFDHAATCYARRGGSDRRVRALRRKLFSE